MMKLDQQYSPYIEFHLKLFLSILLCKFLKFLFNLLMV
jgi:hypothetical protein